MSEKKKMGRPVMDTDPVMIRMSRDMIRQLDEYRRGVDDLPTRPELVRRIIADWLEKEGKTKG